MIFKSITLNLLLLISFLMAPKWVFSEISAEQFIALETAAVGGDVTAQSQLASLYYLGEGVEQNLVQAFTWYQSAAEQGYATAQYSLGNLYLLGEGTDIDQQQALYWYQQAAIQGHKKAQARLETLNDAMQSNTLQAETITNNQYAGAVLDETPDEAEQSSLETQHSETQRPTKLFDQLFAAPTTTNDQPEIKDKSKILEQKDITVDNAANAEQNENTTLIHSNLQPGPVVEQEKLTTTSGDEQKASNAEISLIVVELYNQATLGNQDAQYEIANAYYVGNGVAQDLEKAFLWYKRSAERGNVNAQFQLANVYLMGEGVAQDDEAALFWYAKAAEQGHPDATNNYNNLKQFSQIKDKQTFITRHENTPAPLLDDADSKSIHSFSAIITSESENDYQQGLKYSIGDGVKKDTVKAFEFFTQAANAGHPSAQYQLGIAYAFGEGTEKNIVKAFDWMKKSALNGELLAQKQIANMYLNGHGVEKKPLDGIAWYEIFSSNGSPSDRQKLQSLKDNLSNEALIEVENIRQQLVLKLQTSPENNP